MRAVAAVYDEIGDGWAEWLAERFAGNVMILEDGTEARIAAQVPDKDVRLALYALLASDRGARINETPESLLKGASPAELVKVQEAIMLCVAPSFGTPGRGLARRRRKGKPETWSWRLILETALGLMGLSPEVFWGMTLAEWRAMSEGYAERQHRVMQREAWTLSHLLIAAGCKPELVTVAKLLGEKERKPKCEVVASGEQEKTIDEIFRLMGGNVGGESHGG